MEMKSLNSRERLCKKLKRQGARIFRNEVRRGGSQAACPAYTGGILRRLCHLADDQCFLRARQNAIFLALNQCGGR